MSSNSLQEFLLDGTLIHPPDDAVLRMRCQIERGLNWFEVLLLAVPHGVLPLLSRNLATYAGSVMPQTTIDQLAMYCKRITARNTAQSTQLVKILDGLSKEGIRALPFKGPALAISFYGDMSLRECHDLDFWVDPKQFARATEWFKAASYLPIEHVHGLATPIAEFPTRHGEFSSPDGQVIIEIRGHLELLPHSDFDPDFEQVWERRSHLNLHSSILPVFSVEDLLLGLAVHGSKHRWRRLSWIVDVAAVLSAHPHIDWDAILLRAKSWRCQRRLLTAVTLADSLYALELSTELKNVARESAVQSMVEHARAELFRSDRRTVGNILLNIANSFRAYDSMSGRIKCGRYWLDRTIQADEKQLMPPVSDNLRRACRAMSRIRGWILS